MQLKDDRLSWMLKIDKFLKEIIYRNHFNTFQTSKHLNLGQVMDIQALISLLQVLHLILEPKII